MKYLPILIPFSFIYLLTAGPSFCAPVLYRVQEQKMMKQRRAQEEYQLEYQQYLQMQQQSQAQAQKAAPVEQTYQQKIDQRNQDIAQAIQNANGPATQDGQAANAQAGPSQGPGNTDQQQISYGIIKKHAASSEKPAKEQEDVDLTEVWKKLDKKSTVWTLLADDQAKLLTVTEYIDRYQSEGVKISGPPTHYVQVIDQVAQANPQILQKPFGELLKILAIIDYDFDNGMDKDALARAVLGQAGYDENKKRFNQQRPASQ